MTELRRLGYLLALGVFLADRLSKWWIVEVYDLPARGSVSVLPFFDLSMVWNQGMSMGLFRADGDTARYTLIAVTGAVALGLAFWIWRAQEKFLVLALGMVVGGAAGNIWDRFEYGAVADFLHLHALGYSFYVFNLADSAISIGVVMLLWDALLSTQKTNT